MTSGSVQIPLGWVTTTITDVSETSNSVTHGNDFVDYTATILHTIYTSPSLTTVVATAAFPGEFEIEIFNRISPFETGSFDFRIISQTSSGTIDGKSVTVQLNPAETSGGTTTITPGPLVGEYTINTTATIYSQFIVDGGTPINVPGVPVTVQTVPEPATLTLLGMSLAAGLIFLRWRRII